MEFNKAYNRQEFANFLQNSFLPEDFIPTVESVPFRTKMTYSTQATKLGSSSELDLVVYEVRHTSKNDARVSLSKEAFRMLADEMEDRALVIFVPEDNNDNYRFSLIEITLEAKDAKITRNYSNPRRYSYFLGKGIAYYTPNKYLNEKGRVVNADDLRNRFSVEMLTKEFYNELSDWYAWAIKIIRFPNDLNDKTDDDKYNNESAIRLITRLIFVWFLKQRHLIPDEFFDEQYIADNLIDEFNPNKKEGFFEHKSLESKYYKAILQNLFFAMLNSPITPEGSNELSERHFRDGRKDYDNNKLMRYESYFKNPQLFVYLANQIVPFLNGGLFDCLDEKDKELYYDCFTDRKDVNKYLVVPDYLFFGEEAGKNIDLSEWYGDKKKKKVSARGIIDILKRYNFTVEENTPFDQEVSLDPELLGKVFENLLASYNPETQTTARKQTGSFYTPREIVQYMVDESLVAHLKRTVGEELEPQFRQLMQYSDNAVELSDEQRKAIMQALYNCKILDPACGSGAFPMGILQQMVHILNRIDPDNTQWREMMLNKAINETSEAYRTASSDERKEMIADIERSFDENINRPDYARKLYLIENCIYGVDIQPIAIQISKLRFFISLVVDQMTNNNPADNFGIRPLPNLEAKFVAANTLIGLNSELSITDTDKIRAIKTELKTANHKIFGAKTVKTKRKYKEKIKELHTSLAEELKALGFVNESDAQQLASWDMFNQNTSSPFFDSEWMFGVKDGFDIVIGNPPYVDAKKLKSQAKDLKANFNIYDGTADLFTYFYEKGLQILQDKGVLTFITSNKWIRSEYGKNLRTLLLNNSISTLIDFGRNRFFNATIDTNIAIVLKGKDLCSRKIYYIDYEINPSDVNTFTNEPIEGLNLSYSPWLLKANENDKIKNKLESCNKPLSSWNVSIFRGILTGCNEAYHITTEQREKILSDCNSIEEKKMTEELICPLLQGKDIDKYLFNWKNLWLINIHNGIKNQISRINVENLQAIKSHLLRFESKLIKRSDKGSTYFNLRNCAYLDNFKEPKILWQAISKRQAFSIDSEGKMYGDVSTFFMTGEHLFYIAAILNSKLFEYALLNIYLEGDTFKSKNAILQNFPIPKPENFGKIESLVKRILSAKRENQQIDTSIEENEIDLLVYKLYGLTYDEVLIVDPDTPITSKEYENIIID